MPYLLAQIWLIAIVVVLLLFSLLGLQYALKRLHIPYPKRKKLIQLVGISLLLWLAFLAILAASDFFKDFQSLPPKLALAVIPPFLLPFYLSKRRLFQLILRVLPERWLILIQSFRIVVELFLWYCFLIHIVPFQMTFIGLNHDILVGITAIMASFFFFIKKRRQQTAAILWNISGIILLFNIIIISMISTPSPFRIFMNEPANTFIATFPFIWLPGFIVPFAFAMHVFSIRQLLLNGR